MLPLLSLLASLWLPALQEAPAPPGTPSIWYLERGTERRQAMPRDDLPSVADRLAKLLRDGRVPGFYDGQFASTQHDFEALARVARDETLNHTLRLMAIMALNEAADGERLAAVLEPLVISPDQEFRAEEAEWADFGQTTDEDFIRKILRADVSRHARFALAKDGQPARVLEKIAVMERRVHPRQHLILDPLMRSDLDPKVARLRAVWFDIAYHYQQFDDYEHASEWFSALCDNLTGDDTRWAHYNLACIAALMGRPDEAMGELQQALEAGFLDVGWIEQDGDLTSLRERPDYQALVAGLGGGRKAVAGNPP